LSLICRVQLLGVSTVWEEEYLDDTNTLNVHIHSLRNDLAKYSTEQTPTIKTVWGLGYKLEG
ncbi:winged helix-turn-helix domain-containing protein, partial [Streptococcus equi]